MPKSAQYIITWLPEQAGYHFTDPENTIDPALPQNAEGWLSWLEEHHRFAFYGHNGQINLLKEKRGRGGAGYWYAYKRHGNRMVKHYVGRNAQLSMEQLEAIAAQLAYENVPTVAPAPDAPFTRLPTSGHSSKHITEKSVRSSNDTTQNRAQGTLDRQRDEKAPASEMIQFEPLLMSKLQLPRLQRSLLPRPSLVEMLDASLEHKVTLIAGPAGYGKTTLVGQWIAARAAQPDFPRIAYITLDEGDNDPIRFWRYFIAACQQLQPGVGKEVLELLLAHQLPSFKPLDMMLTMLLNDISQLEHEGILILDDVHVLNASQVITTLSFLLDHLPASLHLLILIRGDLPFSISRLRARNELLDIFPFHLAFSIEETRTFFTQELPFTLSPKTILQLHERLEGWPAGLRLLTRALLWTNKQGVEIEHAITTFASSFWSIQQYFLDEVLHTLPEQQQEFLLQTCILPRITASLCDYIMNNTNSAQLIETLRVGDFFLIPIEGIGDWTRYHTLFAEAMRQEALRHLGHEHVQQLAARASLWYEEHGFLSEAIETALDAAAYTRAATLIEQFMEHKQQNATPTPPEWYTLNHWVERLPEAELYHHPDLCVHYAMCLLFLLMEEVQLPQGKERIQHLLQIAEQKWRDANNTAKLAEVFAFRALLTRQEGKILQAVTWAKQSLSWLPDQDRVWRNLALSVVGVGEILEGHLDQAQSLLLEALALTEQQGNLIYARATRGILCWVAFEKALLHATAEQFCQMQAEARVQQDRDDITRTQLGLAMIDYQWNHLDEAEQAIQEALEIGKQMNAEEPQTQAMIGLAMIEQARGQSTQAQKRLTTWLARGHTPDSPLSYQLTRQMQAALARLQLATGDREAVEHWWTSIEQSEEILPRLQRQRERILHARLLLLRGTITEAIELLESIAADAQQTGHIYLRMEAQIVLLLAYSRHGNQEKASEQLRELLKIARNEEYLRLFLDEGEEMAYLLRKLAPTLHEKALVAYVRHILNALPRQHDTPAIDSTVGTALLLEPLSPQEQKVLRLLAAGNSNADIARELVVSVNTVRTQVQSIYRKLNVSNRVEASAIATQLDLL